MAAVGLLSAVPGCGLLSGPKQAPHGAEGATVRLGVVPIIDVAPVYIAMRAGYFRDEGVDVRIRTVQGGAAGIPAMVSGDLDVTFGNWVSFFTAQAKGTADLKLVADGYRGKPGMFLVLALPDGPVRSAKDLAGRKIAVNTRGNVTELAVRAAMRAQGVDVSAVQFTEMPFLDMQSALQRKDVDAALVVEPFLTSAIRQAGAVPVLDTMTGAATELPIGGYATTAKFAAGNPATLDAFRRALGKAQRDAADRHRVEEVIADYAKVDSSVAAQVHLGSYPTGIDANRLRNVVSIMRDNGMLDRDLDPSTMVL
ncbi:NitT/TauT family transport system substrate-binding protein [Actinocrispum wychmicini]|uniref:NitT/TauT family transport system substrate-binding protein n=2 Tax=Actinocrispum wychmicini TaxID=1213861 RepID=A0A4R2JI25_9PSEU|nr:NitT/TauT family transport system substrate-binding protein [Actinocrispum wychmicini]